MIRTAMILSAGFGERLKPLSQVRPKPLFPVLNKSMLEWWAEFLISAGVKKLVINVHYQKAQMLEHIKAMAAGFGSKLEIVSSVEETILGTGGGIKNAASLLGEDDFLVVNSDIFTDFELVKLGLKHLGNPGRLATLGLLSGHDQARVSINDSGRILGFRHSEPLEGETARRTYCGVMALSPAICDLIPEGQSDIIDVFNQVIANKAEVFGWTYEPAIWSDMGTPDDYWKLNRDLASGRIMVHSTARVEGAMTGWNVVGASAIVEEGASIENSVIWPGAAVSPGARIKNAIVKGLVPAGLHVDGGIFCDFEDC